MKKIIAFLFLTVLFGAAQAKSFEKEIAILNGSVVLEVSDSDDFPCIGIRLSDKEMNIGTGTYLEIKREGTHYLIEGKRYASIEEGAEAWLKDLFKDFYDRHNKKRGKTVWSAFVEEGGLRSFFEMADEIIDEEFLTSPLNTTFG